MLGRKWVLRREFDGAAKLSDFELVKEILPDSLQNGEILCRALWLSVDPYMRSAGGSQVPLLEGGVVPGSQVAVVEKSNHKEYPEGTLVLGYFGWRDVTLFRPDLVNRPMYFYKLPVDLHGLSPSYFLGAVGMPGNAALFGMEKVLEVTEGSSVVVSSAAGAVGGVACQIAKIKGCKVLAFTGSFEKTVWLKEIGAGYIFDYNITDVEKVIKEFAPEGVDYFFDNVGGEFSCKVMRNMKKNGKIALCGAISQYNRETNGLSEPTIPFDYSSFIYKKLKMEGFLVSEWESEWQCGLARLKDWVVQGKIQVQETITEGFEKMPEAFLNLFEGKNIGKQVVKA